MNIAKYQFTKKLKIEKKIFQQKKKRFFTFFYVPIVTYLLVINTDSINGN